MLPGSRARGRDKSRIMGFGNVCEMIFSHFSDERRVNWIVVVFDINVNYYAIFCFLLGQYHVVLYLQGAVDKVSCFMDCYFVLSVHFSFFRIRTKLNIFLSFHQQIFEF